MPTGTVKIGLIGRKSLHDFELLVVPRRVDRGSSHRGCPPRPRLVPHVTGTGSLRDLRGRPAPESAGGYSEVAGESGVGSESSVDSEPLRRKSAPC